MMLPRTGPALLLCALACAGCDQMYEQPRNDPLEPNPFFIDGMSARPIVPGTVARGHARLDEHLYQGTVEGKPAEIFPFAITVADLDRGRERFNIYCSPCHGALGDGDGMIVQRGFTRPPSYHLDRLRAAPVGHFYQVMTNGWGAMYSYAERVTPEDRWRIIAYIRALQLSQHVPADQLAAEDIRRLREASP
ncbi:MAG TPA: cytochrome c [Phycisphaerae bacterium]|nr:cytochrome c [Phycisphaerae bacterium]HOM52948.1 cytochrome c [Phycisphaerae bacterium]HON67122.1 cytochrome c [Phycisphaerae bacterium]HOQ87606.1 cytochrome c [Phycisphaerae bacterium]HPP27203.1 cytochrome c [Phycisphaerae bacterium]